MPAGALRYSDMPAEAARFWRSSAASGIAWWGLDDKSRSWCAKYDDRYWVWQDITAGTRNGDKQPIVNLSEAAPYPNFIQGVMNWGMTSTVNTLFSFVWSYWTREDDYRSGWMSFTRARKWLLAWRRHQGGKAEIRCNIASCRSCGNVAVVLGTAWGSSSGWKSDYSSIYLLMSDPSEAVVWGAGVRYGDGTGEDAVVKAAGVKYAADNEAVVWAAGVRFAQQEETVVWGVGVRVADGQGTEEAVVLGAGVRYSDGQGDADAVVWGAGIEFSASSPEAVVKGAGVRYSDGSGTDDAVVFGVGVLYSSKEDAVVWGVGVCFGTTIPVLEGWGVCYPPLQEGQDPVLSVEIVPRSPIPDARFFVRADQEDLPYDALQTYQEVHAYAKAELKKPGRVLRVAVLAPLDTPKTDIQIKVRRTSDGT